MIDMTETPTAVSQLVDELETLAEARAAQAAAEAALEQKRAAFELENQDLIAAVADLTAARKEAEERARVAAEAVYAATGEPKPIPGVEVKLYDTVEVDPAVAAAWARDHMRVLLVVEDADAVTAWLRDHQPELLGVDMKLYDKILREVRAVKFLDEVMGMPGAVTRMPKATFSRDLSRYLATS